MTETFSEGEFSDFDTEFTQLFLWLNAALRRAMPSQWFYYRKSKRQGYCFVIDVRIHQCPACGSTNPEVRICHKSGKVTAKCCVSVFGSFGSETRDQWTQPVPNLPGNRRREKKNPLVLSSAYAASV